MPTRRRSHRSWPSPNFAQQALLINHFGHDVFRWTNQRGNIASTHRTTECDHQPRQKIITKKHLLITVLKLKTVKGDKPNLMINIKPKQLFASISIYTFLIFAKSWERRNVLIGDDLRYLIPPSLKWDIRWVIEPAKNGYLNVLQKLVGLISSFFPLENLAILMFFMTGVIWIATSVSIQLAVHAYTQKFYAGLISGLVLVMTPSNTLYVIGITATAHFPALFGILVITSFATYPSSKRFFFMIVLMSLVF